MKLEMKLPCPKSEAIESYEILLAVCRAEDAYLAVGYKQMRDLLERANAKRKFTDDRPFRTNQFRGG